MRPWLIYGAIAVIIAGIAAASWQLGEAPAETVAPTTRPAAQTAITPRLPSNATIRTTPTPSLVASSTPNPGRSTPVLPTVRPLAPDVPEPLPPLVFARERQIWRSDGSGAPPQQLTTFDPGVYAGQPAFSPDGEQIAFVALIEPPITATVPLPASKLFLINADGSDLRELWAPAEGILWLPSWTPDGQSIYLMANTTYSAASDEDTESRLAVVRVDLATGERTTIVTGALDPTIAADGSHMAYLKFGDDGVTMHLEIAELDGTNPARVIDGGPFLGFYAPRFTPDGSQIVVAAIEGPETDDQGFPIKTTKGPFEQLLGLLEPPAAEAHGAPWDLWIVNIDGSGLRRLTYFYEDLPMVAFAPDGKEMVIMGYNGFYRMNIDGTQLRRIDPHGDHGGLDWAPSN